MSKARNGAQPQGKSDWVDKVDPKDQQARLNKVMKAQRMLYNIVFDTAYPLFPAQQDLDLLKVKRIEGVLGVLMACVRLVQTGELYETPDPYRRSKADSGVNFALTSGLKNQQITVDEFHYQMEISFEHVGTCIEFYPDRNNPWRTIITYVRKGWRSVEKLVALATKHILKAQDRTFWRLMLFDLAAQIFPEADMKGVNLREDVLQDRLVKALKAEFDAWYKGFQHNDPLNEDHKNQDSLELRFLEHEILRRLGMPERGRKES